MKHKKFLLFVLIFLGLFTEAYAQSDYDFYYKLSSSGSRKIYLKYNDTTARPRTLTIVAQNYDTTTSEYSNTPLELRGKFVLPDTITRYNKKYVIDSIADFAFIGCNQLEKITLPQSVRAVGNYAFYDCSLLDSVIFTSPQKIDTLRAGVFYNCGQLKYISRFDSLKSIGEYAFYNTKIDTVYLSKGTTLLDENALEGMNFLKYIKVHENNLNFADSVGILYNKQYTTLIKCPAQKSVTIRNCMPSSLTNISANAFKLCKQIDTIAFPASVRVIGNYAFDSCSRVKYIDLGQVTSLNINAFSSADMLNTLYLSSQTAAGYYCSDGVLYQNDTLICYPKGKNTTTFAIPTRVVKIGNNAFAGNPYLQSYTCQSGNLQEIGQTAFSSCTALTTITIGSTIKTIGIGAFENCTSLTNTIGNSNFVLPNSLTKINDYTFSDCRNLRNVVLGDNVQNIGFYAFSGDTNLVGTLIIPDSVKTIKPYAFKDCKKLRVINFNANCEEVGDSAKYAFVGCVGVDTINISKGVSRIVRYTFAGCTGVRTINAYPIEAPYVETLSFNTNNSTVKLNVPCGTAYDTTNYWRNFNVQHNAVYLLTIGVNDTALGTVSYNCSTGLLKASIKPSRAQYYKFDYWSDGSLDSVRTRYIPSSTDTTKLTAVFSAKNGISVKVFINDNTRGTVLGGGTYNPYTNVTISVTPNTHYHFVMWNDGNTQNPRVINTDTTAKTFTAIVEPDTYTLTKNATNGSISQVGLAAYGNQVVLTAVPNQHYHFKNWQDGISQNPRRITVYQDTVVTAIFAPDTHQVGVYSTDILLGSVSGSGNFAYGTTTTLRADAIAHYHFVAWSDANTNNPRNVTVTKDSFFVAIFAIDTHTVNVGVNNSTMGSVQAQGQTQYADTTTIRAIANYGYKFSRWNDGVTTPNRTITVLKDTTFTAYFVVDTFRVNVSANNPTKGSVSGSGNYTYNSQITLSATANQHYHFISWSNGVKTNPYPLKVTKDSTIVAQFLGDTINVTLSSNDNTMGYVLGSGTYFYGDTIELTPTVRTGYHFLRWNDGQTTANRNVILSQDTAFTAYFAIDTLNIQVYTNDTLAGSVSGGGIFLYNQQTQLVATPEPHYHFFAWSDGNRSNPRNITATVDTTIQAIFYIDTHSVVLNSNNVLYGSLLGNGNYPYGHSLRISANPYHGYHLLSWNDGIDSTTRTISVLKDTIFTANFAIDTYSVVLQPNFANRGTVSGAGNYLFNTYVTITATANTHYNFVSWSDGNTNNPRTFVATANKNLTANFVGDNHIVNIATNDTLMGQAQRIQAHYGDTLYITPRPNIGHHFVAWSDNTNDNPRQFIVDKDTLFTAMYAVDTFQVVLSNSDVAAGTLRGSGYYTYGSTDTLVATPNAHYHFVQWSDSLTDSVRVISVYSDTTFIAYFEGDPMTVVVRTSNIVYGNVSGSGTFNYASTDTLVAIPNSHHHFVSWDDGNTDNPRVITVLQDSVLTANFAVDTHLINVVSADTNQGTTTGTGYYNYGTTTNIVANAKPYHRFVQWSDGNTQNPRLIVIISDETYTAEFEIDSTNVPEGIDIAVEDIAIQVYPNPTNGMVYFNTEKEIDKVEVLDAVGRLVASDTKVKFVDLSGMAQGVYTLRFTLANKITMRRIIVR